MKSEEHALRELAKKNKIIKVKLAELTERGRQYQISADRLLLTSKDARKLHPGINGHVLKERRSWADRAMYLRFVSEEKLKVINRDLVTLNQVNRRGIYRMQVTQGRVDSIRTSIKKDLHSKKIREESDEFEDALNINIMQVRGSLI